MGTVEAQSEGKGPSTPRLGRAGEGVAMELKPNPFLVATAVGDQTHIQFTLATAVVLAGRRRPSGGWAIPVASLILAARRPRSSTDRSTP
jgi:hypothetical protein